MKKNSTVVNNLVELNGTMTDDERAGYYNLLKMYMYGMFHGATSFNQSISSWNVSSVEDTRFMFENADAFDNGGEPMLDWMIKAGA